MSSSAFSASAAASTGLLASGPVWETATTLGWPCTLTKWIAMLLNEGVDQVYGRTVVPASVHRELQLLAQTCTVTRRPTRIGRQL